PQSGASRALCGAGRSLHGFVCPAAPGLQSGLLNRLLGGGLGHGPTVAAHDLIKAPRFGGTRLVVHDLALPLGVGGGQTHAGIDGGLGFAGALAVVAAGLGHALLLSLLLGLFSLFGLLLAGLEF